MKTFKDLKIGEYIYGITNSTNMLGEIRQLEIIGLSRMGCVVKTTDKLEEVFQFGSNIPDMSYMIFNNDLYFVERVDAVGKIMENVRTQINIRMQMIKENMDVINDCQKEYLLCLEEKGVMINKDLPF